MVYNLRREEYAVLVSGIASMGLEILAGRVIAPEYGSTIYTWGSIIGVFMTALSLGYYFGGKRSENSSYREIEHVLMFAAVYVAVLIFMSEQLLNLGRAIPLPGRYASIIPVTILFGPPTYWLGYISPYAAQISDKMLKGEASGHVYAMGTIGSIIGAFATTFILVPSMGVKQIELLFGLFMLTPLLYNRDAVPKAAVLGVILVGVFAFQGSSTGIYSTQTAYQELTIKDSGGVRTMYLDGQPQSAMYLNGSNGYPFDYARYFHLPLLMQDNTSRVLFIGGGGFSGPKRFVEEYNVTVDVVEIDPGVVSAAKTYFNVSESSRLNIRVEDGREFLQETEHEYDIIVLDAYRKSRVPFHLTTKEFMQLAYTKTTDDGALMANIISTARGPGSKFFRAEYKTMNQVFPQVYAYPTRDTSLAQNIELIASKNASRYTVEELRRINERENTGLNLSREIGREVEVSTSDVPVLTDERAPVDSLLEPLIGTRYVLAD